MYRCIKLWIINEKIYFDFTSFPEKTSGDYAALASEWFGNNILVIM